MVLFYTLHCFLILQIAMETMFTVNINERILGINIYR